MVLAHVGCDIYLISFFKKNQGHCFDKDLPDYENIFNLGREKTKWETTIATLKIGISSSKAVTNLKTDVRF